MTRYRYRINGKEYEVAIDSISDNSAQVTVNGNPYEVEIVKEETSVGTASERPARPSARHSEAEAPAKVDKSLKSPLPGTILAIKVKVGDTVREGQTVAVLEAMKMENEILAEHDGTVTGIHVEKGDNVLEGAVIVSIS